MLTFKYKFSKISRNCIVHSCWAELSLGVKEVEGLPIGAELSLGAKQGVAGPQGVVGLII